MSKIEQLQPDLALPAVSRAQLRLTPGGQKLD